VEEFRVICNAAVWMTKAYVQKIRGTRSAGRIGTPPPLAFHVLGTVVVRRFDSHFRFNQVLRFE